MDQDGDEAADDQSHLFDNIPRTKWYLIDTDGTFCKVWDSIITLLTMYTLYVTPFLLVFPGIYQTCHPHDS